MDPEKTNRGSNPHLNVAEAVWESVHDHQRRLAELERGAVVLFGHGGHPGSLSVMGAELERVSARVSTLEQLRWKLAGVSMIAGSLTGLVTGVILFALSRFMS